MATAAGFLSEDHYLCSICIEVFSEPVSIPCGHNFCKDCLSKHWGVKEVRPCPLCKNTFSKGLEIKVNTALRDIVENFKKHQEEDERRPQIQPGQVACDCCSENKMPALKTCLVCLTSFCAFHLEPHQQVPALRRHKLTRPVPDLEEKICKKHDKICELFCKSDKTSLCAQCTDHDAHDIVPLQLDYVDKKAWRRKIEFHKRTQKGNIVVKSNENNPKQKKKTKTQRNNTTPNLRFDPTFRRFTCQCSKCRRGNHSKQKDVVIFAIEIDLEILTIKKSGWAVAAITHPNMGVEGPRVTHRWYTLRHEDLKALKNLPILETKRGPVLLFVDLATGWVSLFNGSLVQFFPALTLNDQLSVFLIPVDPEKDSWGQYFLNIGKEILRILLIFSLWILKANFRDQVMQ